MPTDRPQRRGGRGRPGRRGNKVDVKVKLERSRQSARECRARKKLRYQYLEDLVSNREQAIFKLREELELVSFHFQSSLDIRYKYRQTGLYKWEGLHIKITRNAYLISPPPSPQSLSHQFSVSLNHSMVIMFM